MYDVFMSYASEDRGVASRLAEKMRERGVAVWFDLFEISLGDSLSEKINEGLLKSNFGLLLVSKVFLSKITIDSRNWVKREYGGLSARETGSRKLLVPIWLNVFGDAGGGKGSCVGRPCCSSVLRWD